MIAHDGKKTEILSFVKENEEFFKGCRVIATNSTGQLISDHTSISVIRMLSGPLGGDLQIGSLVASGQEEIYDGVITKIPYFIEDVYNKNRLTYSFSLGYQSQEGEERMLC